MTETFIKERKHNLTGNVEPVGIDDASAFLCRFANGSLATFEATRYARGHKALYTLEINGEHLRRFGIARPASHSVFRSPRRRDHARMAQRSHHRRRSSVHEALVGAGAANRIRTHLHSSIRRLPASGGRRQGMLADIQGRFGDRSRDRRGVEIREDPTVGGGIFLIWLLYLRQTD